MTDLLPVPVTPKPLQRAGFIREAFDRMASSLCRRYRSPEVTGWELSLAVV
jgi:hypothetical protein